MELILASQNRHKIREFNQMFADRGYADILFRPSGEVGLLEDVLEDGETFEANALLKAAYPAMHGYIGVADDSGLAVEALGWAPGVLSARYAGVHGDDEANNQKLLRDLESVPDGKRRAKYVCVIAVVWPLGAKVTIPKAVDAAPLLPERLKGKVGPCLLVRGECFGEILRAYQGQGGFGYDPLFYIPEQGKTFAEMAPEAKNAMSHRGFALKQLIDVFQSLENL